ncbi:MAG: radical SAM protein [Candidatus Helarchaeota archaeon]
MNFDIRIPSFYKEIKEINEGKFPYPRVLSLYPTNKCQFNCTFCDYKELNSCNLHEAKELNEVEWKYILNTFKNNGGEGLHLCGGGEPLMLSSIEKLLAYANNLDLKIGVVTNGLNIDKYRRRELYYLLLDTCSYIRISFEAGSPEVFKKIKGKDHFYRILENVDHLISDKSDDLQISYKYTISSEYSLEDINRAIDTADDLRFDSIQFKAVCNVSEKLSDKDRALLSNHINKLSSTHYDTKVICGLDKYRKKSSECLISLIQTLIDYNGDIFICCYYNHRIEDHKIGNIFKDKFENIWGSYEHYKKLMNIDCNKCNLYDCRYIKYNHIIKDLMKTNYLSFI